MSRTMTVRTNPHTISGGKVAVIGIEVADDGKVAEAQPTIEVVDGKECGAISTPPQKRSDNFYIAEFTGTSHVENCTAKLALSVPDATEGSPPVQATTEVVVHTGVPTTRIDGLSAVALVVLLCFALDRIVRGLFFLLSYVPGWARAFPDAEFDDVVVSRRAEANRRLVYFAVSLAIALVVLGWFANVRLLAALGFDSVSRTLDVIVTALVLTAGAERTQGILQGIGAGGVEPPAPKPTPIEITGRLTVDDQSKRTLGV